MIDYRGPYPYNTATDAVCKYGFLSLFDFFAVIKLYYQLTKHTCHVVITSAQGGYVSSSACLSVCLSVRLSDG